MIQHYINSTEYSSYAYQTEDDITAHFNYYVNEAEQFVDRMTSGIDNVKKLRIAFPTKEEDIAKVKICMVNAMSALSHINMCNVHAAQAMEEGKSGIVGSVSSGSESISYVTDAALIRAAQDPVSKSAYINAIIRDALSGVQDANGVNLLYGGAYPYV